METLPGKVPRVRLAHPSLHFSQIGTKRTRKAIERHKWAVGDRVDALIRDGYGNRNSPKPFAFLSEPFIKILNLNMLKVVGRGNH